MHTVQHRYDRNDIMLGVCSTCGHGYCNGLVFQILIRAGNLSGSRDRVESLANIKKRKASDNI